MYREEGEFLDEVILGRTGIRSGKNAFGALPIQRVDFGGAEKLLRRALEGGITFFDTARAYSDSEEKLGRAFSAERGRVVLATKTTAKTPEAFWRDLETSLRLLQTDYVDIYQFHTPDFCPRPGDGSGLYEAMLEARERGMLRFIGISNHRLHVAREAVDSGLYDTLQFPLSYLASEKDLELVARCREQNVGFIAMKALSGGLLTNGRAAYAWMRQFSHVLPIWGIQREEELEEFLSCAAHPPALDDALEEVIARDRGELSGGFCRGCGYCMPCPVGIKINNCARMAQLIRRSPSQRWLEQDWQTEMRRVEDCMECGQCVGRCPYELDTPALLKQHYADYLDILEGKVQV